MKALMVGAILASLALGLGTGMEAAAAASGKREHKFVTDLDVPLPNGYEEDPSSRVVFDKPEGRIVTVQARRTGPQFRDLQSVRTFYKITLSVFGWKVVPGNRPDAELAYTREGDRLDIHIEMNPPSGEAPLLTISVTPISSAR